MFLKRPFEWILHIIEYDHKLTYIQVTIGIFFGFAITSMIARIGFRIHAHRSLYLDDYIALIGAICLCAAIGVLYWKCDYFFLIDVLRNDSSLIAEISANQIKDLFQTPYAVFHGFYALIRTTIFAVKFSFLIFFKKLIHRVSKIYNYYWTVAIITFLSWLFAVLEPLVVCSHVNKSLGRITHAPLNLEYAKST